MKRLETPAPSISIEKLSDGATACYSETVAYLLASILLI